MQRTPVVAQTWLSAVLFACGVLYASLAILELVSGRNITYHLSHLLLGGLIATAGLAMSPWFWEVDA